MQFRLAIAVLGLFTFALAAPVSDYEVDPDCIEDDLGVDEPAVEPKGDLEDFFEPGFEQDSEVMIKNDAYDGGEYECEDAEDVVEPAFQEDAQYLGPGAKIDDAGELVDMFDEECATDETMAAEIEDDDFFQTMPPVEKAEATVALDCEGDEELEAVDYNEGRSDSFDGIDFPFAKKAVVEEAKEFVEDFADEAEVESIEECEDDY